MKKIICLLVVLILIFGVLLCGAFSKDNKTDNFNYLEYAGGAKVILVLDSYVVMSMRQKSATVFNKSTGESFNLSDTVFDEEKSNLFLISGYDNTLIYTAKDKDTSGSAVYEFNIDTLEKKKLKAHSSVVNTTAFLGLEKLLGIPVGTNDMFSVMQGKGNMLFYDGEIIYVNDLTDIIKKSPDAEKFSISEKAEKIAVTNNYIFFLSNFGELLRFDRKDKSIVALSKTKIKDFFCFGGRIYFSPIKNPNILYESDFSMSETKEVGITAVNHIRIHKDKLYFCDEEGQIHLFETGKIIPSDIKADSSGTWDTDGEFIYFADFSTDSYVRENFHTAGESNEQ